MNPRAGSTQRLIMAAIVNATRAVASQRSVRRISPALRGARKRHKSRYRGIIQGKKYRPPLHLIFRLWFKALILTAYRRKTPRFFNIFLSKRRIEDGHGVKETTDH
jgi:hypothetical protein